MKAVHVAGYIHKCDMPTLCRRYGKDPRTVNKLICELITAGFIGENERTYFLRNGKFITNRLRIGTRAFKCSPDEIRDRKVFESKLFAARVDYLNRYYTRKHRRESMKKGRCAPQIPPLNNLSTGLLSKVLNTSTGKISTLKRISASNGFLQVKKSFIPIALGSSYAASLIQAEFPGVFSRDGVLVRRSVDALESRVITCRIKRRKALRPINKP
jgi:hypothetical protein